MKKVLFMLGLIGITSTALFAGSAYSKCVGCHGANGEKAALGKSKVIKDMTKQEIIDALVGYQNGTYGGAMKGLMVAQSKSLSQADIEAIAAKIGK
jgi:cytochrome c553